MQLQPGQGRTDAEVEACAEGRERFWWARRVEPVRVIPGARIPVGRGKEEADLVAGEWSMLIDYATSPGYTSEAIRIYLARDLSPVPEGERHKRDGEELGMPLRFVSLDEAYDAVVAGRLHNPHTVIGIFAAYAARSRGWATLNPADVPWPLWERLRGGRHFWSRTGTPVP